MVEASPSLLSATQMGLHLLQHSPRMCSYNDFTWQTLLRSHCGDIRVTTTYQRCLWQSDPWLRSSLQHWKALLRPGPLQLEEKSIHWVTRFASYIDDCCVLPHQLQHGCRHLLELPVKTYSSLPMIPSEEVTLLVGLIPVQSIFEAIAFVKLANVTG